jgi:hypothetical protein
VDVDLADVHDARDDDALRMVDASQQRRAARRGRQRLGRGLRGQRERERADEDGESRGAMRRDARRPSLLRSERPDARRQGTTETPGGSKTPFWSTST